MISAIGKRGILALAALALAACGVETGITRYPDNTMVCAITLPAGSTDEDVQLVVNDVLDGQLNACSDADPTKLRSPELVDIERDDIGVRIRFRYYTDSPPHLEP